MFDAIRVWLLSDSAKRVGRTLLQVFGGVVIAFLLDFGHDGIVSVREYIFGDSGVIVVGTTALALWMNRRIR